MATKTITGNVTFFDGEDEMDGVFSIPVYIGGTDTHVFTDEDGNYSINVPPSAKSLVFIGHPDGLEDNEQMIRTDETVINIALYLQDSSDENFNE